MLNIFSMFIFPGVRLELCLKSETYRNEQRGWAVASTAPRLGQGRLEPHCRLSEPERATGRGHHTRLLLQAAYALPSRLCSLCAALYSVYAR